MYVVVDHLELIIAFDVAILSESCVVLSGDTGKARDDIIIERARALRVDVDHGWVGASLTVPYALRCRAFEFIWGTCLALNLVQCLSQLVDGNGAIAFVANTFSGFAQSALHVGIILVALHT